MEKTAAPQTEKKLGALVSQLAQIHNELWEQEDHARSKVDSQVVAAKRKIDVLNQKRNDLVERIDEWVVKSVQKNG